MKFFRPLAIGLALLLGLSFVMATGLLRHPAFMAWHGRFIAAAVVIGAAFLLLAIAGRRRRAVAAAFAFIGAAGIGSVAWQEWAFARLKADVLAAPEEELRAVGRHLMVGYGDVTDLRPLVTKAAVAGVFIAKRNAEHADALSLAGDVTFLQDLRARAGLPPLWIASDQEGGLVSSLSPPLPRPRALSAFADNPDNLREAAADAAKDIACLGLNLDFAPVVDLKGASSPADRFSRIAERSISADPAIVAKTAGAYCEILAKDGVLCTLKHFPGLGRVAVDTHVGPAVLPDLDPSDLAPFHELTQTLSPRPWVMLSHATVASLDAGHPASASRPVIDILRHDWSFDGLVVTDDAWMAPYRGNLEDNLLGTLGGGADIVLIAYDPDLTYRVLDILLRARRSGRLPDDALRTSNERLARLRPPGRATGCPSTLSHVAFLAPALGRPRPTPGAIARD